MKKELSDLQPILELKTKENNIMLGSLQIKQKDADEKKAVMIINIIPLINHKRSA